MKYDSGKPQLSLIPPAALVEIAKIMGFGAQKYGPNNWREDGGNTEWSRTYSSIQRHLNSFWDGEDTDPESGMNHLAHAATQIIILMIHQMDGHHHMDDRYKPKDLPDWLANKEAHLIKSNADNINNLDMGD